MMTTSSISFREKSDGKKLPSSFSYWSEYDVPVHMHSRFLQLYSARKFRRWLCSSVLAHQNIDSLPPFFIFLIHRLSLKKKKTGRTMFFPQLRNYLSFFNCGLKSPFSKWKDMLRNRLVRMSMTNPTSTHHTRFEPLPHYRETPWKVNEFFFSNSLGTKLPQTAYASPASPDFHEKTDNDRSPVWGHAVCLLLSTWKIRVNYQIWRGVSFLKAFGVADAVKQIKGPKIEARRKNAAKWECFFAVQLYVGAWFAFRADTRRNPVPSAR